MKLDGLMLGLLILGACGDGAGGDATDAAADETDPSVALQGLYEVTSETRAEDCLTWEDEGFPLPFVDVRLVDDVLEVRNCRQADDCDDYAETDKNLTQGTAGNWRAVRVEASYDPQNDACLFVSRRTVLTEPGADAIELSSVEVRAQTQGDLGADDAICDSLGADFEPDFSQGNVYCWKLAATRVE